MILSVIIVNYNVKELLAECLQSVYRSAAFLKQETEVIVIDNNSADNSIDYLEPLFPEVRYIINKENLGFAKACNQGIKASSGKYVLFLNPDTIVPEECFQLCIGFLDQHKDVGAVGVRMLDGNGNYLKESKRGFPAPAASFYKLSGLARLFPRSKRFARYYLGHLDEYGIYEAEVLSGAFMMVRREVLDKAGYFDESFFMYGEDIDLSYRMKQAGYKNFYLGNICITHFKGKSSRDFSAGKIRVFYDAMKIFVSKYYNGKANGFSLFVIRAGIEIRKTLSLFNAFIKRTLRKPAK